MRPMRQWIFIVFLFIATIAFSDASHAFAQLYDTNGAPVCGNSLNPCSSGSSSFGSSFGGFGGFGGGYGGGFGGFGGGYGGEYGASGGGTIGSLLCSVAGWFTGPVGSGIATLAILVIGIGALMGKVSWGMAIITGVGVSVIFGADTIVMELGGQSCYGFGFGSFGGFGF